MRVAVIIPALNEAATIGGIALGARGFVEHVAVVDDGSTDVTGERARRAGATALRNDANQGKGASLWRGMRWALEAGADAVITLDGDGQHRPEDIPRVLAAATHHPDAIIIAARLRGRARAPRLRRFANRFADFWISWAAGHRIVDSQSGFRLYPASLLRRIDVSHERSRGFVFESEILIEAARLGVRSTAVEVDAIYNKGARASHYCAFTDTARIVRMVAWKLVRRGLYPLGLLRVLRAYSLASSSKQRMLAEKPGSGA